MVISFFFFNDTATTEIYTLSLHDALPISVISERLSSAAPKHSFTPISFTWLQRCARSSSPLKSPTSTRSHSRRSEEHTSELQSRQYLVCRLLLEKKKIQQLFTYLHKLISP